MQQSLPTPNKYYERSDGVVLYVTSVDQLAYYFTVLYGNWFLDVGEETWDVLCAHYDLKELDHKVGDMVRKIMLL